METKEKKTGNVDRERPALWSRDHGAICPLASHLVTGTHGPQWQLWGGGGTWPGGPQPSWAGLPFLSARSSTDIHVAMALHRWEHMIGLGKPVFFAERASSKLTTNWTQLCAMNPTTTIWRIFMVITFKWIGWPEMTLMLKKSLLIPPSRTLPVIS